MYEKTLNQHSITRTLSFKIDPVNETFDNIVKAGIIDRDEDKANTKGKVQSYFDRHYKKLIEDVLSKVSLEELDDYADVFYSNDKKELKDRNTLYNSVILDAFYNGNSRDDFMKEQFQQPVIKKVLEETTDSEEYADIVLFNGFKDYLDPYFTARKTLFNNYNKANSITNRILNDNLPIYLRNCKIMEKVLCSLTEEDKAVWSKDLKDLVGMSLSDLAKPDSFSYFMSQSGIDKYNLAVTGYSIDDKTKVRGLNEYINIHNTKHDKKERLRYLETLHKMILSEEDSISYTTIKFLDDQEVIEFVKSFSDTVMPVLNNMNEILEDIRDFDRSKIYISNISDFHTISKLAYGDYNRIKNAWKAKIQNDYVAEQEKENETRKKKRNIKEYSQTQLDEKWKKIERFSITELNEIIKFYNSDCAELESYLASKAESFYNTILEYYEKIEGIIAEPYPLKKVFYDDVELKNNIVVFLREINKFNMFCSNIEIPDKAVDKDESFYDSFEYLYSCLNDTNIVFNSVRAYATAKPFKREFFKISFDNARLGKGWDISKDNDYRSFIFIKDNDYYFAFGRKGANHLFEDCFVDDNYEGSVFRKMMYKQMGSAKNAIPKLFIKHKGHLASGVIPKDIYDIYVNKEFKAPHPDWEENKNKLIAHIISMMKQYENWNMYNFNFKEPQEYADFDEFADSVGECAYLVDFKNVPESYIYELVKKGDLYLFRVANKDFSPYSKGTPNLHTMYFKELFEKENLESLVYKLCGGASVYYEKKRISEDKIIKHKAGEPIKSKGYSENEYNVFLYDLIKDRRFTVDSFKISIPIKINPFCGTPNRRNLNKLVLDEAVSNKDQYIIGIDRGERNLIYAVVINKKGEIIEQHSFNVMDDIDHKQKLVEATYNMLKDRKMLLTDNTIENLKLNFVDKAVEQICKLAVKYDAVLSLERLDAKFKSNRRSIVEYTIYSLFESRLTNKLSCYVNKKQDKNQLGGLLKPLQLATPYSAKEFGYQNGIMMFVEPSYTSTIDPVTGFVNEFTHPYTNIKNAKTFIGSFDDIRYNPAEDYFEFDVDYDNIKGNEKNNGVFLSYRRKWTICSVGRRLVYNKKQNSKFNEFNDVILTKQFKALFEKYGIDISSNIKEQILENTSKEFFKGFLELFRYTCQLRNCDAHEKDMDYILSPVKSPDGTFFDSRKYIGSNKNPQDSDANGAYHIAIKALITLKRIEGTLPEAVIKAGEDKNKKKTSKSDKKEKVPAEDTVDYYISTKEWLAYKQN